MSTFKRRPSSVQILLALAEEGIATEGDGGGPHEGLNGHYALLRERLAELGVEIKEGQSPEDMYREAARQFKRSQSSYQSKSDLPPVQKLEIEVG